MWWLVTWTFSEPMLTYCSLDILNKLYESIWHKPFIAYMWHVMACRLWIGKKGLSPFELVKKKGLSPFELVKNWYMWWLVTWTFSEPMLTYCSLDILNKLYESIWHKPFIAYMWHVMACRLMNAKPFHVLMQTYCSMDLFEQTLCTYMVWAIYCLCVTLPGFVLRSTAF